LSEPSPQRVDDRSAPRHVPELDGVRGLAIAAVMALHFLWVEQPRGFIDRTLSQVSGYGLLGVDLFFVLSGFLITGILYDARGSHGYFKNFYMRRTLRIFPLYFGVLLLLVVILPAGVAAALDPELVELRQLQGWLWTYLTNVHLAREGAFSLPYLSHFWSLAIEEHFYLVWPLVIAYLPRRAAMACCIALSFVALIARTALAYDGQLIAAQVLTPCRLDTLCIGAFFALAARGPLGLAGWGQRARSSLWIGALGVVALSLVHKLLPAWDFLVLEFRGSVVALTFGFLVVTAADPNGLTLLRRFFGLGLMRTLGKYSYGLYVFHGIIAYALEHGLSRGAPGSHYAIDTLAPLFGSYAVATLVQAAAGVLLSVVVAVLSYELFELRFLKLKDAFTARRSAERSRVAEQHSPEIAGRSAP
jgi:peptidoglycan/LPS O-acetylase OafA/YrhL